MEMNDNTILRIKVPAHLYESVKAQLTLKEAKQNFGTKDMKPVKGQKAAAAASDKPKAPKSTAPKATPAPKASVDAVPKDGMEKAEKKKMGLEELRSLAELLNKEIMKLEEKEKGAEEKAPVEEKKEADHEQEGQE